MTTFGNWMRECRKAKNKLTMQDLASQMKVATSTIYRIETNRQLPNRMLMERWAAIVGVSVELALAKLMEAQEAEEAARKLRPKKSVISLPAELVERAKLLAAGADVTFELLVAGLLEERLSQAESVKRLPRTPLAFLKGEDKAHTRRTKNLLEAGKSSGRQKPK